MRISDWSADMCSSDLERLSAPLVISFHQQWRGDILQKPTRVHQDAPAKDLSSPRTLAFQVRRPFRNRIISFRASSEAATSILPPGMGRSEEHTSETPVTNAHPVCRLLLEKKKKLDHLTNTQRATTEHPIG